MWKTLNCDFADLLTCIIAFRNPKKEGFISLSLTNVLLAWGSAFLIYEKEKYLFNPKGYL